MARILDAARSFSSRPVVCQGGVLSKKLSEIVLVDGLGVDAVLNFRHLLFEKVGRLLHRLLLEPRHAIVDEASKRPANDGRLRDDVAAGQCWLATALLRRNGKSEQ